MGEGFLLIAKVYFLAQFVFEANGSEPISYIVLWLDISHYKEKGKKNVQSTRVHYEFEYEDLQINILDTDLVHLYLVEQYSIKTISSKQQHISGMLWKFVD